MLNLTAAALQSALADVAALSSPPSSTSSTFALTPGANVSAASVNTPETPMDVTAGTSATDSFVSASDG